MVGGSRAAVADHQCVYLLLLLLLRLVQAQYNILRLLSEVIKGLPPPTPLKQQGKVGRTHPVWGCGDTTHHQAIPTNSGIRCLAKGRLSYCSRA